MSPDNSTKLRMSTGWLTIATIALGITGSAPSIAQGQQANGLLTPAEKEALISPEARNHENAEPRSTCSGDASNLLFPFINDGTWILAIPRTDDGSSTLIALPFSFRLYGTDFTSCFINNNGNVSFGAPFGEFSSSGFPLADVPMVAPFWADADTRESESGTVWYKFIGTHALAITWDDVGYFFRNTDRLNTFQVVLTDGTNPVVGSGNTLAFSFDQMCWTTGDASDGVGGFGGSPAVVGVNVGDGTYFQIGRFNIESNSYAGPNGDSGVYFLTGLRLLVDTRLVNVKPIAVGLPASNEITLDTDQNQSLNLALYFLSPESGQTTSVNINDSDGAVARGLLINNTPGNAAFVTLQWTPTCASFGTYHLAFNASDSASPAGQTNASLAIHVNCSIPPHPNLVISSISPPAFAFEGQSAQLTWTVENLGAIPAQPSWNDAIFLSPNPDGSNAIPVGNFTRSTVLPAGQSYTRTESIFIPPGLQGTYYFKIMTDSNNSVAESGDENNNEAVALDATEILQSPRPDLHVTQISAAPSGFINNSFTVNWTVTNEGEATANGSWLDRVYLSTDATLNTEGEDQLVGFQFSSGPISSQQQYVKSVIFSLPEAAGSYYIFVVTDIVNTLVESDETNNTSFQPIAVVAPDYRATVQASIDEAVAGTAFTLSGQTLAAGSNTPVGNKEFSIRIRVRGTRRVFNLTSDPSGNFSYPFTPLPGEAGLFAIFADHPAVSENPAQPQDTVRLLGLQTSPSMAVKQITVGQQATGEFTLLNTGDVPVTDIQAAAQNVPGNLQIQITAPSSLLPLESGTIGYSITASDNSTQSANVPIVFSGLVNGNTVPLATYTLQIYVINTFPNIVANPSSLSASMVRESQNIIQFTITNIGAAPATNVRVGVPCAPNPDCTPDLYCGITTANCVDGLWLHLVTPEVIDMIGPGQSSAVQLALQPSIDLPLGIQSGQLTVLWNDVGIAVPFQFRTVSDRQGSLLVQVQDELTWYDENGFTGGTGPLLAGATIQLTDAVDGTVAGSGVTDSSGAMLFPTITEGRYNIDVTAPNHGSFHSTFEITADQQTTLQPFLPSQQVTYTWTVTPTEDPDHYTIVITTNFETNVPVPVVTIDPPIIDLGALTDEVSEIDLTITNHGLISAEETELVFGTHPNYSFEPLIGQIGKLTAGQSLVVPVIVTRTQGFLPSVDCQQTIAGGARYNIVCGTKQWYWVPMYFTYSVDCPNSPPVCGCSPPPPPGGGGSGGNGDGGGSTTPGGGGSPSGNPPPGGCTGCPGDSPGNPYVNPPAIINDPPPNSCEAPPPQKPEEPPPCPVRPDGTTDCNCKGAGDAEPTSGSDPNAKIDPVYLFSGEFYQVVEDLRIPGRGMDFVWTRKYRSKIGPDTVQGKGWDFSYNISIQRDGLDIVLSDGRTRHDRYTPQSDGSWGRSEFFQDFVRNPDNTYTLTLSDKTKWNFAPVDSGPAAGKIIAIVDRNNNQLTFHYDAQGRVERITDTLNRDFLIAYNLDGYIASVTDFAGRQIRYEYYHRGDAGGSDGDLKSITTPVVVGTPNGNDFQQGKTTTYTYSTGFADDRLNHNMLTITDGRRNDPSDPTSGTGSYLTNVYASTQDPSERAFDRLVRQAWGNPTDIIDLVYVPQSPSPVNLNSVMTTILRDRLGNVTHYDYDIRNRLVRRRDYTGRASPIQPTTLTQNRPAGKLRLSDPDYFETRYAWNDDSNITQIVHPNGNVTKYVYELDLNPSASRRSRGNLREIHHLPGTHTPAGDQNEIVEKYEYDTQFNSCCGFNFVTKNTDGRNKFTQHQYDINGNRIHTTHRIDSIVEDFEYNQFGQLTAHVLPDNGSGHRRRDEYTYYDSGIQKGYRHQEIVDAGGFALTTNYEYDSVGNVIRVIDPRGHDTQFVINALNQVVREISREVLSGSGIRYQRDRYYDANNNLIRLDVQNVDENGVVQSNAYITTQFEYEILNKLIRKIEEVDASHSIVTEYGYDAVRNQVMERLGEATNGNQPTNVIQTIYDERDSPFQVIRGAGGSDHSTTQNDYDANGNLIRVKVGIESTPNATSRVYDGFDRLVNLTDSMGNVTTYHYDANGNRVSQRIDGEFIDVPGNTGNGRLSQSTFIYDDMDRLTRTDTAFFDTTTQAPIGSGTAMIQTFYSDNSQVIRVINARNFETLTFYDTANRRSVVTDAKNNTTTFIYDTDSNIVGVNEVEKSDLGSPDESFHTTLGYDNLNRLTLTADNLNNTTQFGYDSRNNQTITTDARGNVARMTYDGRNRLTKTIREMRDTGDGTGTLVGMITTKQTWDDSSRLIGQTDNNENTTSYLYDALNRKTGERYADGTMQSYILDVHGNPITTTDANGSIVTSQFDLLDRLTRRDVVPGSGVSHDTTFETYAYDGLSRLVSATDDDSVVTRQYDSLSYVTRETQNGQIVACIYDALGNETQCTYPGGRVISTTYDELNRKKIISDTDGMIATYSYFGPRRVERRVYGNNTRSDWSYDGARRITRTRHVFDPSGTNAIIDDRTYVWDATYNKTQRKDIRASGPQLTHDYSYDSISRLVHTVVTDATSQVLHDTDYILDGVGNRVQVTGGPDAGTYMLKSTTPSPADFQMNQYTRTPFDSRGYDSLGNLTGMGCLIGDTNSDGVLTSADVGDFAVALLRGSMDNCLDLNHDDRLDGNDIQLFVNVVLDVSLNQYPTRIGYDYRNRMVVFQDLSKAVFVVYHYDALGRRFADDVTGASSGQTTYYYDDWYEIENRCSGSNITIVIGNAVDELLLVHKEYVSNGWVRTSFFHEDDLGNIMSLSSVSGSVVERYEYGDYGAPSFFDGIGEPQPASQVDNNLLFGGRRYDTMTHLIDFRTRTLDVRDGRFVSRDLIGIWGDSESIGNSFDYVVCSPWTNTDPLGLFAWSKFGQGFKGRLSDLVRDKSIEFAHEKTHESLDELSKSKANPFKKARLADSIHGILDSAADLIDNFQSLGHEIGRYLADPCKKNEEKIGEAAADAIGAVYDYGRAILPLK